MAKTNTIKVESIKRNSSDHFPHEEAIISLHEMSKIGFDIPNKKVDISWDYNDNHAKSDKNLPAITTSQFHTFIQEVEIITSRFGFMPILTELTLHPDMRVLPTNTDKWFVSYISSKLPMQSCWHNAYLAAMEDMREKLNYFEPIVTHPEFFSEERAFIRATFSPSVDQDDENINFLQEMENKKNRIGLIKYPLNDFKDEYTKSIEEQVQTFCNFFRTEISSVPMNEQLNSCLKNTQLLLFPIQRYKTDYENNSSAKPSPEGALFLFIVPRQDKENYQSSNNYEELAVQIKNYILECSLRESDQVLGLIDKQRKFLAATIHGAVTAIRSIKTGSILETLEDVTLIDKRTKVESTLQTEEIFRLLSHARVAENIATAFISFSELSLEDGCIRQKFQNNKEVSIKSIIVKAKNLVENLFKLNDNYPAPFLVFKEDEDSIYRPIDCNKCLIPKGYIHPNLLTGLFMEIFKNACQHGKPEKAIKKVNITCQCSLNENGGVDLKFTNDIDESQQGAFKNERTHSFIENMIPPLRSIKGIDIKRDIHHNSSYEIVVSLGEMESISSKQSSEEIIFKTLLCD